MTIWTNAPVDYDGFGTATIEHDADTGYRKVDVRADAFQWQTDRYVSGFGLAWFYEERYSALHKTLAMTKR